MPRIIDAILLTWKIFWGMPLSSCDKTGHDLKELHFNHVHFKKGQREVYCFTGPVEYCARRLCPYQKFLGNPSLWIENCDYDAAPLPKNKGETNNV